VKEIITIQPIQALLYKRLQK